MLSQDWLGWFFFDKNLTSRLETKKGIQNVVVDHLSRLIFDFDTIESEKETYSVETFPDE